MKFSNLSAEQKVIKDKLKRSESPELNYILSDTYSRIEENFSFLADDSVRKAVTCHSNGAEYVAYKKQFLMHLFLLENQIRISRKKHFKSTRLKAMLIMCLRFLAGKKV